MAADHAPLDQWPDLLDEFARNTAFVGGRPRPQRRSGQRQTPPHDIAHIDFGSRAKMTSEQDDTAILRKEIELTVGVRPRLPIEYDVDAGAAGKAAQL